MTRRIVRTLINSAAIFIIFVSLALSQSPARAQEGFADYINGWSGWERRGRALYLGVFNSPSDARWYYESLRRGESFPDFDDVYATSPDGTLWDISRAVGIHVGIPAQNPELPRKNHFRELYCHSQGVDVFLTQAKSGEVRAESVFLMAPPGGQTPGYRSSARVVDALRMARVQNVKVFINRSDPITFPWFPPLEVARVGDYGVGLAWTFRPVSGSIKYEVISFNTPDNAHDLLLYLKQAHDVSADSSVKLEPLHSGRSLSGVSMEIVLDAGVFQRPPPSQLEVLRERFLEVESSIDDSPTQDGDENRSPQPI